MGYRIDALAAFCLGCHAAEMPFEPDATSPLTPPNATPGPPSPLRPATYVNVQFTLDGDVLVDELAHGGMMQTPEAAYCRAGIAIGAGSDSFALVDAVFASVESGERSVSTFQGIQWGGTNGATRTDGWSGLLELTRWSPDELALTLVEGEHCSFGGTSCVPATGSLVMRGDDVGVTRPNPDLSDVPNSGYLHPPSGEAFCGP